MSDVPTTSSMPRLFLVRHGETAWSISRQHTGRTDLPLTENGEQLARSLAPRLAPFHFGHVFTSPLQRARRTCELAGFGERCVAEPDLMEIDYGRFDGLTTPEIQARHAGWDVFDDGAAEAGGESPAEIERRTDQLLGKLRALEGDTLCFGHAHSLRALAARWLGLPLAGGKLLMLGVATLSVLGYEHDRDEPVVLQWNA